MLAYLQIKLQIDVLQKEDSFLKTIVLVVHSEKESLKKLVVLKY